MIGKQIKQRRIELELTQTQVATTSGLSQNYISDIERGLTVPTFAAVNKLTLALGSCSVLYQDGTISLEWENSNGNTRDNQEG